MAIKKLVRFDWAIKYILRNKANFDVLEAFISNLLRETIVIENILESESNREVENRKFNRVDLKCIDSQGKQIIIEIQNQR
ncbi:MAG: PD-(D/E)XK nuclease family transposase, partial [Desulfosporosinus sp.]|nr:PD-(D/E)XK nuclease family transposase [Desulfosporosinus sp.]